MKKASKEEATGRGFRWPLVGQWIIAKRPGGPSLPAREVKMKPDKDIPLTSTQECQAGF